MLMGGVCKELSGLAPGWSWVGTYTAPMWNWVWINTMPMVLGQRVWGLVETTALLAPACPAQLLRDHQGCFAAPLHRSGLHPATKLTQHCSNTQQEGEKHLLGGFGSLFYLKTLGRFPRISEKYVQVLIVCAGQLFLLWPSFQCCFSL